MTELLDRGTAPKAVTGARTAWTFEALDLIQEQTADQLIDASWRASRHQNVRDGNTLKRGHRDEYRRRLDALAAANRRRPVVDLLAELSEQRGVGWSDIADQLDISVPALRKWRKSSSGTAPENHARLAALVAFYSLLHEVGVASARWMSMPLVTGYTVTAADLYSEPAAPALLDHAADNIGIGPEALLDELDPGWRETRRSEYEVVVAPDGMTSLKPRRQ